MLSEEEIQVIQAQARGNLPADLTVRVKGETYTVRGPLLAHIDFERNRSTVAQQSRNARLNVRINTDLRNRVMEVFGVSADTASMLLAAVRRTPVQGWKPEHLDLAVRWDKGWRLYEVTGTRHAYYLLRKLAQRPGFQGARLNDILVRSDGWILDNIISLDVDDVTGSDRHGKYRALLDRRNSHYDLERDLRERLELDRQETQSDRDAWYGQDR